MNSTGGNNMKKNILALALVGLMFTINTSTAFADEVTYSKYTYTQKAKENNFELNQLKDDFEDQLKDYKTALRKKNAVEELTFEEIDDNYKTKEARYTAAVVEFYNPLVEAKQYFDQYVAYEKSLQSNKLQAELNFYNYIIAQKNADNKSNSFKLMKTKFSVNDLEYELGKISEINYKTFQKSYNDSYTSLLQAYGTLENAKNTLNKFIMMPITDKPELDHIDITLPKYAIENIDEMAKTLLNSSYQIQSLTLEKERIEGERTVLGRYSGVGSTQINLENLRISLEETVHKIEDAQLDIPYQLYTNYNNTLIADNNFKSAKLSFEIAKDKYEVDKIKNDHDMISTIEFIESKNAYDDAWANYMTQKLNAYKAIVEFNNFITLNTMAVPMDLK